VDRQTDRRKDRLTDWHTLRQASTISDQCKTNITSFNLPPMSPFVIFAVFNSFQRAKKLQFYVDLYSLFCYIAEDGLT